MAKKIRLDKYLVMHALAEDEKTAQAYIMSGIVYSKEVKLCTAGTMVGDGDMIEVRNKSLAYVSRGGLKMEKAIKAFDIKLDGFICMDIGASTGGFTDCMLQNGAKKVFSVDVGYGQLAWKLRSDERVVNLERTNIRFLDKDTVGCELDFASCDVSFISLELVLPVAHRLLKSGAHMAALIKPQFEAPRDCVGEKGVVSDASVHKSVISKIAESAEKNGFSPEKLDFSPIKGPEGNIEYLIYLKNDGGKNMITSDVIEEVVSSAHSKLN